MRAGPGRQSSGHRREAWRTESGLARKRPHARETCRHRGRRGERFQAAMIKKRRKERERERLKRKRKHTGDPAASFMALEKGRAGRRASSAITLGVVGLAAAAAFGSRLSLSRRRAGPTGACFFQLSGGSALSALATVSAVSTWALRIRVTWCFRVVPMPRGF